MMEKIWLVVEQLGDNLDVSAFTHEVDASTYAEEERSSGKGGVIKVLSAPLVARGNVAMDDAHWGVEVPDVNSGFVEGLLHEIDFQASGISAKEISEKFLEAKCEDLRKEASDMLRGYILDELKDYLENADEYLSCED